MIVPLILPTCAKSTVTRFEVVDYRADGNTVRYRETFARGFYDRDAGGNVEVVLTREKRDPDDPGGHITQVIHIRTIWRSIPGVTIASRSQINAEVCYYIISGEVGQSFEGAGSVIYTGDDKNGTMTGTLDLARLKPVRRLVAGDDLFDRVDLSGTFTATENRRRVRDTVHDFSRRFGPRPR